mgnify:CR=1 FL=1
MKMMILLWVAMLMIVGCTNKEVESMAYRQSQGKIACPRCVNYYQNTPHVYGPDIFKTDAVQKDIVSIKALETDLRNVWNITFKGRCDKHGDFSATVQYSFGHGKLKYIKFIK